MTAPVNIAGRRLRVSLEEPVETSDGIGGVVRAFAPRVTLWARLEPLKAIASVEADRAIGQATHRLIIRWRGDVTTAMRFRAGATLYAIAAHADPAGLKRDLVCFVRETQP